MATCCQFGTKQVFEYQFHPSCFFPLNYMFYIFSIHYILGNSYLFLDTTKRALSAIFSDEECDQFNFLVSYAFLQGLNPSPEQKKAGINLLFCLIGHSLFKFVLSCHQYCHLYIKIAVTGNPITASILVETSGIEPLTSCMPCKRSPS